MPNIIITTLASITVLYQKVLA